MMFLRNSIHGSTNDTPGGSNSQCPGKFSDKEISISPVQSQNLSSCGAASPPLPSSSSRTLDDIAEDAVICILSFLSPREISACCCLNKWFRGICSDDCKVWLAMCERRWGAQVDVRKWGNGRIRFRVLYEILKKWENLVGFWRGVGHGRNGPLIVFDWGAYYIIASRIMAVRPGSYEVCKVPFLWMGVSPEGKYLSFIDPDWLADSTICKTGGGSTSSSNFNYHINEGSTFVENMRNADGSGFSAVSEDGLSLNRNKNPFKNWGGNRDLEDFVPAGLVSVDLSFVGNYHIVVEESSTWVKTPQTEAASSFGRRNSYSDFLWKMNKGSDNVIGCDTFQTGSLPDNLQSDVYQYFANKVSPSGNRAARKQRRKEKERATSQGRRKWEAEHFVKVVNCFPTPACPLQGLWKGICDSMGLDFILVSYDKFGGIVCRKVGEFSQTPSGHASVFWTANCASFTSFPLSAEEEELYNGRTHIRPLFPIQTGGTECTLYEDEQVTQVLCINPISALSTHNFRVSTTTSNMEGRLWQYASGNFGFGFLHNNTIVDYKHIGSSGRLLDIVD